MLQVVDIGSGELVHFFTPCRKERVEGLPPSEPPITKMFTSIDGQWLAAVNCFGDVYIFNLELQRWEINIIVWIFKCIVIYTMASIYSWLIVN